MFELSREQFEKYKAWSETILKDIKLDELGVRESFVFIPHSAGMAIKVVCGEHQLDLTDYSDFNLKKI